MSEEAEHRGLGGTSRVKGWGTGSRRAGTKEKGRDTLGNHLLSDLCPEDKQDPACPPGAYSLTEEATLCSDTENRGWHGVRAGQWKSREEEVTSLGQGVVRDALLRRGHWSRLGKLMRNWNSVPSSRNSMCQDPEEGECTVTRAHTVGREVVRGGPERQLWAVGGPGA